MRVSQEGLTCFYAEGTFLCVKECSSFTSLPEGIGITIMTIMGFADIIKMVNDAIKNYESEQFICSAKKAQGKRKTKIFT